MPEPAESVSRKSDVGVWRARNAYLHDRAARLCHDSRDLIASARTSLTASRTSLEVTRSSLQESRSMLGHHRDD
jgi:hypothetical protein